MNVLDNRGSVVGNIGRGSHPSFCESFCTWKVWRVAIYAFLVAFSYQMPDIIAPVIGKHYFGDTGTYSYWNGIFTSLSGVLGFLFQGYIGQLSDIIGRKKMMIIIWFAMFLSTWWLTFTRNAWVYLALMPISEMNGSFGGIPTVLQASLADVIYPTHRTLAFGTLYGLAGLVVIVASILTAVVENSFGITYVMIVYDISMGLTLFWLVFVYKETLSIEKREINKIKYEKMNQELRFKYKESNSCVYLCKRILMPFRPLLHIRDNKIIFWFGIIALFVGLPESGIDDLLASYCYQILGLDGENEETTFSSLATISLGVSMLVTQLAFLPCLLRFCSTNDVFLISVALLSIVLFSVWGIIMYFIPVYGFGLGLWAAYAGSFITIPITSGSLSRRLDPKEQGIGMGVIHAMKGITWAVAPYLFSSLFDYFENDSFLVTMPFVASTFFILCAFPILYGPLRTIIRDYDDAKLKSGIAPVQPLDAETRDADLLTETMLTVGDPFGDHGTE